MDVKDMKTMKKAVTARENMGMFTYDNRWWKCKAVVTVPDVDENTWKDMRRSIRQVLKHLIRREYYRAEGNEKFAQNADHQWVFNRAELEKQGIRIVSPIVTKE